MKKRQLKSTLRRRPETKMHLKELSEIVSERTGFRSADIRKVISTSIDVIIECMLKNVSVALPKIGMFYPALSPPRAVVHLFGGKKAPEKRINPPRWNVKFHVGKAMKAALINKEATQQEIDNLYKD